jgi:hypothetical protein
LTLKRYPFQLWKENWKNSTKNMSVILHEVKWEEEKNHKIHTIKIMYQQLENWMHEGKWVSRSLLRVSKEICQKNYVWDCKVCIKNKTCHLTFSMEQSSSWEANRVCS